MELINTLRNFDNLSNKNFDEHDVSSAIQAQIPEGSSVIDFEIKAELMAFEFEENCLDIKTGWGTYFGPRSAGTYENGYSIESPSIKHVTTKMIEYWKKRITESINPILIARYAGLVWDFENIITGKKPSHETAQTYIKAIIEIANENYFKHEVYTFHKLERALSIALELNKSNLTSEIKQAILTFEDTHSKDDQMGLWGYAFDLLVGNRKVGITEEEEQKIINELEHKLRRLSKEESDKQNINPWAVEAAAERLAKYYKKKQQKEDVKRVILKVGEAYESIICSASALQASACLEQVQKLYLHYNLKNEADAILLKIRQIGPQVNSELKTISHSYNIPRDKMDEYVSYLTAGDLPSVLSKIAIKYIPSMKEAEKQILDLSKMAPLSFIMGQKIQDEKGRLVATIGSLENDREGHIVISISENLRISAVFLEAVLNEVFYKKGFTKSDLLSFIMQTPIIQKDRLAIIDRALDAYFQKDFLVFIHLIIPQIEEAIRNIVEYSGGIVLKPSKNGNGGFNLKTFDEILRDSLVKEAFSEDFADYLRIVYTDQRGWNLRNSVCHGMATPNMFNSQISDRVLHTLICLGLIQVLE